MYAAVFIKVHVKDHLRVRFRFCYPLSVLIFSTYFSFSLLYSDYVLVWLGTPLQFRLVFLPFRLTRFCLFVATLNALPFPFNNGCRFPSIKPCLSSSYDTRLLPVLCSRCHLLRITYDCLSDLSVPVGLVRSSCRPAISNLSDTVCNPQQCRNPVLFDNIQSLSVRFPPSPASNFSSPNIISVSVR